MLHVAQANRIFFEIPNTHLKHTGAYSKVLHTYYGIVKQYLNLVYSLHKYDTQTPIIPFISFDVTPIAKSRFCDRVDGFNNKIIRIELPYEALINISKYMKLLAHEIYHYVAPINRVSRNLLVAHLSFSIIIGQMGRIFIENKVAKELFADYSKETATKEEIAEWDERFNSIANLLRISALTTLDLKNILERAIKNYGSMEVDMSYIAPQMKEKFETLSANLKNDILKRDVQINTMQDLIRVLEEIVAEGEK